MPAGQAPATVPGWCERRGTWTESYLLQRYFGIDLLPPADDAPGGLDICDSSRSDKWVSLTGDPPPHPEDAR